MKHLEQLIKNEFNVKLKLEHISDFNYTTLGAANDLLKELNISKLSFEDNEFALIYEHKNYQYLKLIIDRFKTIKDLKLPNKNY